MTLRERIADWISGGKVAENANAARISFDIAAALNDECDGYAAALRAILTARNITEARKIARDALGEE